MRIQTPVVRLQQCGRPQPINRELQRSPSLSHHIQEIFHPLTELHAARSLLRGHCQTNLTSHWLMPNFYE